MWWLLALLAACSTPPRVSSVDPETVVAGAEIKVLGEGFSEGATVALVREGEHVPLTQATIKGDVVLDATVPGTISAGDWMVSVTTPNGTAVSSATLTVVVPEEVRPCGGLYKAVAEYSRARREIVIDKSYGDGRREVVRMSPEDVLHIEYELWKLPDGDACSTIFLVTATGRQIFDDDRKVDLKKRSFQLGTAMGKDTRVTREDDVKIGEHADE